MGIQTRNFTGQSRGQSNKVLEMFLGSRDHSNRGSREGSMGPPSRQSSNASATSISSLQDATGSQFFEVLYLGKIKSVSHRKAPVTFIDDVLEKFRTHDQRQNEEQKIRQTSLPVPVKGSLQYLSRSPGRASFLIGGDEGSSICRLVDTKEEEETADTPHSVNGSCNTLSTLKQTEEALKTLSQQIDARQASPERMKDAAQVQPESAESVRVRTSSGGNSTKINQTVEPIQRGRASSTGSCNRPKRVSSTSLLEVPRPNGNSENNRTMLLQIGRCDVKLISPDRKSVLLSKPFCDISHCSQGLKNAESFGFICREATSENNVCYVFKCQSSSVADEIMAVLKQASHSANESHRRTQCNMCDQCPAVWLQKLINDLEGLSDQRAHQFLMKRINSLPEMDQQEIVAKYKGADLIKTNEQNDLLLLLLKAHCEARQMTHVHDTAENRHEFLSQYFDRGSGAIFKKAKRSLTNSFDQLLKRKSTDETNSSGSTTPTMKSNGPVDTQDRTPTKQTFRFDIVDGLSQSPFTPAAPAAVNHRPPESPIRPRSSTLCSSHGDTIKKELKDIKNKRRTDSEQDGAAKEDSESGKTPILDIFFKVGHPVATQLQIASSDPGLDRTPSPRRPSTFSWRQAIFQQVKTPNQNGGANDYNYDGRKPGEGSISRGGSFNQPRIRPDYKALWRQAIKQQILLIRMEKENKRLKAHQEEMAIKRMKLHYEEILSYPRPVVLLWEKLLSPSATASPDLSALVRAVEKGVPKQRRGESWRLLVNTRNASSEAELAALPPWCRNDYHNSLCRQNQPEIDYEHFPLLDVPYEELLGQLTSHQHAIIIDLGRTFPTQKYFQASLGPGQLSLYNLLKAYSLFDSQVGYCQGLSFIGGVLLMHLDEKEAYYMLRYLMLELGFRRQYLPDMAALQVQLYQMARLLRDLHRDLYEHLEENEISPTLYAAPWFLTLFASQFPLGFVARVFDLIFVSGMSMVFHIALSLLADHKDMLLQCRNFEQLMDYFKTTLPFMGATQLERVIRKALELDISRQLATYEVEYYVLQEEMTASASSPGLEQIYNSGEDWMDKAQRLEEANQGLQKQVRELQAQLQSTKVTTRILENNLAASQSKYFKLERKLYDCESDRTSLIHLITDMMKQLPIGQELVIPPDLVRCLEEFGAVPQQEGGISISIATAASTDKKPR